MSLKARVQALKARWRAEESELGKLIKNKLAPVVGLLGIVGELLNDAEVLALQQYLPPMVFRVMAICALLAAFAAKWTKKSS